MNRRRILIMSAAVVLMGLLCLILSHFREPRYGGQSLSYWFNQACKSSDHSKPSHTMYQARNAIIAIGSNALPFLVNEAFVPEEDSSFRKILLDLGNEFPNLPLISNAKRRSEAFTLISLIGPPAKTLLPLVHDHLDESEPGSYHRALMLLTRANTNEADILVPIFSKSLQNTNYYTKAISVDWFLKMGRKAGVATPDLTAFVKNRSVTNVLRSEAARVLAEIGEASPLVIDALQELFHDPTNKWEVRCFVAANLLKLDSRQTEAFSFLTNSLTTDLEPKKVKYAAWQLEYVGTNAWSAIPVLLDAIGRTNDDAWIHVKNCLEAFKVPVEQYLPAIRMHLSSTNEDSRFEAARVILRKEPSNSVPFQILFEEIKADSVNAYEAALALSDAAGTNAIPLIPALLDLLDGHVDFNSVQLAIVLEKLAALDAGVIPVLREKLKTPSDARRLAFAATILRVAHTDEKARRALIDLIRKEKFEGEAIAGLALAGPAAQDALPLLRELAKSSDPGMREDATRAIMKIDPNEPPK